MEHPKILIVEDEFLTVEMIRQCLSNRGFDVVAAVNNGDDALRAIEAHVPDLILMDIHINGDIDGIKLTGIINRIFNIPIVYLTAFADEQIHARIKQTAAYGYIVKPFEELELFFCIEIALYKHKIDTELKESEEKFRSLFENSRDAMMTLAPPSWAFTSANPATVAMFGAKNVDEIAACEPWKLSPEYQPDGRASGEKAKEMIEKAMRDGSHYFEWTHRRIDGGEFPVTVLLTRMELAGKPFLQATVRDITEQKLAEDHGKHLEIELRHAQKMESIGQLASGIAHEINTPMQYVGDNTRFLQKSFDDLNKLLAAYATAVGEVRKECNPKLVAELNQVVKKVDVGFLSQEIPAAIQQSLEGIERVTRIVRAMRDMAHPETAEKTLTDINRIIESTAIISRYEWKYVADMDMQLDHSLPPVPCLPGDFSQVILNLIVNAAHAIGDVVGDGSKGKGTITIKTELKGEILEIAVKDTGTGISEENRQRIFEPFFTTKPVGKGTGQGLAICRNVIVKKLGGTMNFETETGKGTSFIIRLPLA
ncbi:MAG: response regulator [Planctomycetes bacterium]|nr:response regulator [Planctomycetota bacterium]